MALTDQQERFCQEYLIDLNATKAADRAKYSKKTANEQGSRLLANVKVQARIQELMDERSKRTEITSDIVLKELLLIAKTDLSEAFDEQGSLKDIHDIPENIRRAIAGVEVYVETIQGIEIGRTKKLKLWDKNRALEMLGRHLKLFTDKVEHSGSIGLEGLAEEELDKRIEDLQKKRSGRNR